MRLSVLVSGPGAARLADALRASGRLDVVAAPTEAEARAYLSGTAFDRVLDTSPDGAVAALAGELGVAADRVASDVDPASVLRRLGGPGAASAAASLSDAAPALGGNGRAADAVAELQALGEAISELAHRLNNPVAIVQGNAQLAFELGRTLDLDPTLAESLRDIEAASHRLAAGFRELGALRARVDAVRAGLGDG